MKATVNPGHSLQVQGLCKNYGAHHVVADVDLTLDQGESLAVIGHNGAGKTTLMKLILGLTRASAGHIKVMGENHAEARLADECTIGFLPEVVSFSGGMTGRQILRFYARLKKQPRKQCEELLELVGLTEAASQKVRTYSKGMRQRLGLAQALLGEPSLLLLDEPTSGLDPFLRRHFYEIIEARQAVGTSIIVSSHALTEIEAQTDRIVIMKQGRIIAQGSLTELRERASLPVKLLVTCHTDETEILTAKLKTPIVTSLVGQNQLLFGCPEAEKLQLINELTAHRELLLDLVVQPPRLDDLYTFFVNGDDNR